MKKIKLVYLFCLLFVISTAQAQFRYGVKAGGDVKSIHFNKGRIDGDATMGFHAGPMIEYITPTVGLGFDISVLYSRQGLTYHNKSYTNQYIDIPLNLKWRFGVPLLPVKGFLTFGPYLAFAIGDNNWTVPTPSASTRVYTRDKDAGLNIGVGVDFLQYFQVGLGYRYGITDGYEVKRSGTTYAQNRQFTLSAAVLF